MLMIQKFNNHIVYIYRHTHNLVIFSILISNNKSFKFPYNNNNENIVFVLIFYKIKKKNLTCMYVIYKILFI